MKGMDPQTGEMVEGEVQLQCDLNAIFSTPIGSRVMRRDYGAALIQFVDAPINQYTISKIQSSIASTLMSYMTQFHLKEISVTLPDLQFRNATPDSISIVINGIYLGKTKTLKLNNLPIDL